MGQKAIRVHCIGQEYWYVRRNECTCGGKWEVAEQSLADGEKGPIDILSVTCDSCEKKKSFKFDISPFFGTQFFLSSSKIEEIASESEQDDEVVKDRLKDVNKPTMERTIEFIKDLSDARDTLALEYIGEALSYFHWKASEEVSLTPS